MVDQVEPFLTAQPYHLRVGWALTEGYSPYPGGGEGWGGNGVGDDLYSYGFDGLHLWSGKKNIQFLYLYIPEWNCFLDKTDFKHLIPQNGCSC